MKIEEELTKYVELGSHRGILSFINKYYGDNLPDKLRSLWCLDASRNKFLLKYDNKWSVDLEAQRFRELTFDTLQKIFYEKQKHVMDQEILDENGTLNEKDLLNNVNFLTGFIDKKNQMKIIKDLSKKLYFKKENINKKKLIQNNKKNDSLNEETEEEIIEI